MTSRSDETRRSALGKRILLSLLRILAGVPIVSLLLVGLLLVLFSVTLRGRAVGLSLVGVTLTLYCCMGYWNRPWFRSVRRRFLATMTLVSVACYVMPLVFAMSVESRGGHVRCCFLRGQGKLSRFGPVSVVPEVDQLNVAMTLLPLRDPHVDFNMARRMKSLVQPVYRDLGQDAGFSGLGTALGFAYQEVVHLEFRHGHYNVFLPVVSEGEKLPCLIFLHGLGGNTKSRLWVLSKISEQMACAVIAPSFGIGNWEQEGGAELVVDVAREAIEKFPLDEKRIYLMGYSNGAMGVTRAAVADPPLFKGLIYLSPVTEDQLFAHSEFLRRREDRKLLFLHGGQDSRIPRHFVENTVARLRQLGCDVQLEVYEDEGHFLLLARQGEVLADIVEFMRAE